MSENTSTLIPIDDATAAQLRHFATAVMGIDAVHPNSTAASIRAKIEAADSTLTHIDVIGMTPEPQVTPAPPPAAPAPATGATGPIAEDAYARIKPARARALVDDISRDPKVRVIFTRTGTIDDVRLSVNGATITAKRNTEVDIPYRFLLALRNAKVGASQATGETHPMTGMPIRVFVDQFAEPFNVLSTPSEEAVAAWEADIRRLDAIANERDDADEEADPALMAA